MNLFFYTLLAVSLCACSDMYVKKEFRNGNTLKDLISQTEDSLKSNYDALMRNESTNVSSPLVQRLIQQYVVFYKNHPNDSITPYYLDKVNQLYIQEKQYTFAVSWMDTLLVKYPKFKGRGNVLLNAGSTTDLYLNDTVRVRKYYTLLFSEYPKLNLELKEGISKRLAHLECTYDSFLFKKN